MTNETELRLSRRFDAAQDRVFDAWTNPDVLREWWAAGPGWECPLAEVDLREGGAYRLSMKNPDGDVHTVVGRYLEVIRPERLRYTWAWEGGENAETEVAVEFRPDGDGTEVVLVHSGFPNGDETAMHEQGWTGCLAGLEAVLAREPVR